MTNPKCPPIVHGIQMPLSCKMHEQTCTSPAQCRHRYPVPTTVHPGDLRPPSGRRDIAASECPRAHRSCTWQLSCTWILHTKVPAPTAYLMPAGTQASFMHYLAEKAPAPTAYLMPAGQWPHTCNARAPLLSSCIQPPSGGPAKGHPNALELQMKGCKHACTGIQMPHHCNEH